MVSMRVPVFYWSQQDKPFHDLQKRVSACLRKQEIVSSHQSKVSPMSCSSCPPLIPQPPQSSYLITQPRRHFRDYSIIICQQCQGNGRGLLFVKQKFNILTKEGQQINQMERIIDEQRRSKQEVQGRLQSQLRAQKRMLRKHLEEKNRMEGTLNEFKAGNIYNVLEKGEFLNTFLSDRATKFMQKFQMFTMGVKEEQTKGNIDVKISDCIEKAFFIMKREIESTIVNEINRETKRISAEIEDELKDSQTKIRKLEAYNERSKAEMSNMAIVSAHSKESSIRSSRLCVEWEAQSEEERSLFSKEEVEVISSSLEIKIARKMDICRSLMRIKKNSEAILFEGDELSELRSNCEREAVLIEGREPRMVEGQIFEIVHEHD